MVQKLKRKVLVKKVAINIKTEGVLQDFDYLEQLIHDGTRARFAGGSGVSGAVTVGNATNTVELAICIMGYYDANSTDAGNGSSVIRRCCYVGR